MSVGGALSRVFRAEALVCSHCGSTELYPYAGLFGELGGVLGRVRYACRGCRRHSWRRPDAEVPREPSNEPQLEAPRPPCAAASLDALDIDVEHAPLPPPRTDLRALDEDLARVRRRRKKH
jgi:hypothetical protein